MIIKINEKQKEKISAALVWFVRDGIAPVEEYEDVIIIFKTELDEEHYINQCENNIAKELRDLENITNKKLKSFELANRDFTYNGEEVEGNKPVISLDN